MRRLAKESAILAAVVIAFCFIGRLCLNNTYTAYIPVYADIPRDSTFHMEEDGENRSGMAFGEPEFKDRYVKVQMRPEKPGSTDASLRSENGEGILYTGFHVGRFLTVYDIVTGGFTGDRIVMCAISFFFLVEGLLMLLSFRRAKGPDFYSYFTIYTAGFSVFMLLSGIVIFQTTLLHILHPDRYTMLSVYGMIASSSSRFMFLTFPFVLVFAAAMTISNIELLRHERKRLRNVLGILISLIMVITPVLGFLLFGGNFAGSETEYRIHRTLESIYATIFAYFECMLLGSVICGLLSAKHIPKEPCDYIVILGCGFRKDGTLPPLLRGRVDRAISFRRQQLESTGKNAILVPSGGQGGDEVMAEAEAMRRYLVSAGIPEESILPENKSANTYQNMAFSKKLIEEKSPEGGAKVVFSTTNYHVFRSGVWASLAGLKAEGIGSSTKWWFWPNAFMRECVGLLANRWKQEVLMLVIITAFFAVLSLVL